MQQQDDQILLAQLRSKCNKAFVNLYQNHRKYLFYHINEIVQHPQTSEDIFQDVAISIFQKFPSYCIQKGSLACWMITIAKNKAIDFKRSKYARYGCSTISETTELGVSSGYHRELSDSSLDFKMLCHQINRLPVSVKKSLQLAFIQGYTHEEVAGLQNIPLGTVKTRIRQGIKLLREQNQ